jgi:UDP-GlcNAc:undecaprenyl-phosphate GlcNAc-1-phosphate transferase
MGFKFFPNEIIIVITSLVYLFMVINSVNYQDGIDGLAGGLAFVSLLGFAILSFFSGNSFALGASVISLGATLAFLFFNFPPAKIFMGDSGSYSLGFILFVLAITFSKSYNIYSAIGPIFIIGLPILDGVYTNIRRIFSGKSIFLGDRSHFYDKLLKKFSIKETLVFSYCVQILLVFIGLTICFYA